MVKRPSSRHNISDTDLARTQPPIWSDEQQEPPFVFWAFLRVSLVIARRSLGPLLGRLATALAGAGAPWLSGQRRVNCQRLGRAAGLIPSHRSTGRALLWLAEMTRSAGQIVLPTPEPAEPPSCRTLLTPRIGPAPRPQRPRRRHVVPRPEPSCVTDEPIILSIRGLLADSSEIADPVIVQFHPRVESPAATKPATAALSRLAQRGLSPILAHVALGLFMIPAMVRATLLHLAGTDLRIWQ